GELPPGRSVSMRRYFCLSAALEAGADFDPGQDLGDGRGGDVESWCGVARADVEDGEGVHGLDADLDDDVVLGQDEEFQRAGRVVDDGAGGEDGLVGDGEQGEVDGVLLGLGGLHGPVLEQVQAGGDGVQGRAAAACGDTGGSHNYSPSCEFPAWVGFLRLYCITLLFFLL